MARTVTSSIAVITILAGSFSLSAQVPFWKSYAIGSILYVHAGGGLALRAKPEVKGQMLTLVKFGEKVTVITDAQARVSFSTGGINGSWVKVRYGKLEGYQFDGYLSRWAPVGKEQPIQDYLEAKLGIEMETDLPPDTLQYNMYEKIRFNKGVEFEWSAPIGSNTISFTFPANLITFQELYLMGREQYPDILANCPYKENDMSCQLTDDGGSVSIYKTDTGFVLDYSHAD